MSALVELPQAIRALRLRKRPVHPIEDLASSLIRSRLSFLPVVFLSEYPIH
jgi:hypothetical protein